MNVIEAMEARHSVRSYQNKPIEEEKRKALEELARKCNAESGLNIQLCFDEEEAFQGMMAHYGLLGGDDLSKAQDRLCDQQRGKALLCDHTGLWRERRGPAQEQAHRGSL